MMMMMMIIIIIIIIIIIYTAGRCGRDTSLSLCLLEGSPPAFGAAFHKGLGSLYVYVYAHTHNILK